MTERFEGADVTCRRGNRLVFAGLDFALPPGGALVLTGANGTGKTSLLRLMAGLLPPWRGRLGWSGGTIADDLDHHHRRVRLIGHLDAVKPGLTALETLCAWGHLVDRAGAANRSGAGADADTESGVMTQAESALAWFGLEPLAEVPGRYLSAGQKRRLALARLLMGAAPLWLLDEPSNALDRAALGRLEAAIARHRGSGGLVVLSTHADWRPPDALTLDLNRFQVAGAGGWAADWSVGAGTGAGADADAGKGPRP